MKEIKDMSYSELVSLKAMLGDALKEKTEKEMQQDINNIVSIVRKNKISYGKLMRALVRENGIYPSRDESGEVMPIYYNPKNPLEVYDGSGNKPKWFKDLENTSFNIDAYNLLNSNHINEYK